MFGTTELILGIIKLALALAIIIMMNVTTLEHTTASIGHINHRLSVSQ